MSFNGGVQLEAFGERQGSAREGCLCNLIFFLLSLGCNWRCLESLNRGALYVFLFFGEPMVGAVGGFW